MEAIDVQVVTNSEEQTLSLGRRLARVLRGGDVVALDGALGAGKTRLVRGIAAGLGIDVAMVSSPTFVIMHEHERKDGVAIGGGGGGPGLIHVDAYRLRSPEELETIGWDRVMRATEGATEGGEVGTQRAPVVVVEWASKVAEMLPRFESGRLARVRIEHAGEHSRAFAMSLPRSWGERPGFAGILDGGGEGSLPTGWTRCPVTNKPVSPESRTFPFFDERARMADLGRWLSGGYSVSRELVEEDLSDPDLLSGPPGPHG
ncbi:MAG: tRNA (adenosine(37)-N6)-threonylcarbamoyltransferase complex ATPase subunit type 1 TsaE [Phycisphaerales bacterium]|nr:tRNA (adenosine(37)-N6)-threonylcarbamoyltransferase complex ATPase subunit type 1 TsaE [Phycisphaerales bacterium]